MERDVIKKLATQGNLKRLPGNEYFKKNLLVLKGAHAIYFKNYFAWKRVCEEYRNVDNEIRFNDNWRWRKQKDIIRTFHNMIVSFRSYLDHIKVFNKQIKTVQNLQENINTIYARISNDQLTCFITVLRDMMVHRQVYPLVSKGIFRENASRKDSDLYRFQSIRRSELESYIETSHTGKKEAIKNRKSLVQQFLQDQPDNIDIELVVNQHFDALNSFHKEIVFEYISAFKDELIQFRDGVTEHLKDFNGNIPVNPLQIRYLQSLLYYHNQHPKS